jgi:hypothetical protein
VIGEVSEQNRVLVLREQYDAIKGTWHRSRFPSLAALYEGSLFRELRASERAVAPSEPREEKT